MLSDTNKNNPRLSGKDEHFLLNVTLTVEVALKDYTAASGPDCRLTRSTGNFFMNHQHNKSYSGKLLQ